MKKFYAVTNVWSAHVVATESASALREAINRAGTKTLIEQHRAGDSDAKKRMLCLVVGKLRDGVPPTRCDLNFEHDTHIMLDLDQDCNPQQVAENVKDRLAAVGLQQVTGHLYMEVSASGHWHALFPRLTFNVGADIHAYERFFGFEFDPTTKNTSRLMALTGLPLLNSCFENLQKDIPAEMLNMLRAAVYSDGKDVAMLCHPERSEPLGRWPEGEKQGSQLTADEMLRVAQHDRSAEQYRGLDLSIIADCLIEEFGGIPSEGQRNQVLYMLAKELLSITDNDETLVAQLIAPYNWFGLSDSEAKSCIKSASKKYEPQRRRSSYMDRALAEALGRQGVAYSVPLSQHTTCGIATVVDGQSVQEPTAGDTVETDTVGMELPFNPFSEVPVAMPAMKDWPAFPRFLVKNVPLCCAAHCLNQLEPALATYLTGCTATSINGEIINLYAGNLAFTIAPMSSGKSSRNEILRRALARMKKEDEASRKAVEEWNALARRTKTEDLPEKPVFNSHLMGSDATSAALMMRLKQLSEGALFIGVDEMSMLTALQSSSSDSKGPLLLAFSQEDWTVERSTELGESGSVSMMLNVSAMGTPYQAKKFFENGYHSGLLSRTSIATNLSDDLADDEFFYKPYDDAYQETLEKYIDKLVVSQHKHLSSKAIDRHIRKLREDALTVAAATGSESLRVLVRRQLIIATRRAYLYLILNDMKFTKKLENFLTWRFQYGIWAMYSTLGDLISKEEAEERGVALKRGAGPCCWLAELGATFSEQQLTDLRKTKKAPTDRHSVQKLLNTWKARGYIEPDPTTPNTWRNLKKRS